MIRQLTPADFELYKSMRLEGIQLHPKAFIGSYEEEAQLADARWKNILEYNVIFAWIENEVPMGMAGYFFSRANNLRHIATVFTVYVKEEFRGRKIMDQLLKALEAHGRKNGIEQFYLKVGTYNTPAITCYKRNGFTEYCIEPRALKVGDEYVDEHLMVKLL